MAFPGAANVNGSRQVAPPPSSRATQRRGGPEAEEEQQKRTSGSDQVNVSASARALAEVMLDKEPKLQLSAEQLRKMSTPDSPGS